MSVYLYRRLQSDGVIAQDVLTEALALCLERHCSLIEGLLVLDPELALDVSDCFCDDGEEADPVWRPDPRLLLDLPPGICERLLAFPFRERGGAVEVATVSPLEGSVRDEFVRHLGRPVALFRGGLQGLLAAAGAPIDLHAVNQALGEGGRGMSSRPLPLVRRSVDRALHRERTRTAPGIGKRASSRPPPSSGETSGPSSALVRMLTASDARQLSLSLGLLISGPSVIFEINGGYLHLRAMSPHDDCDESPIPLAAPCGLNVAVTAGRYVGPWYPCEVHERYGHVFGAGDLVRIDRLGTDESGLVVARRVTFDGNDDSDLLARAQRIWDQLRGRNTLFG